MKRQSNQEFLSELMSHSRHGALAEIFVMDALHKFAFHVAETPIEDLRQQFGEHWFVSADVWQEVAAEIKQKLQSKYDS